MWFSSEDVKVRRGGSLVIVAPRESLQPNRITGQLPKIAVWSMPVINQNSVKPLERQKNSYATIQRCSAIQHRKVLPVPFTFVTKQTNFLVSYPCRRQFKALSVHTCDAIAVLKDNYTAMNRTNSTAAFHKLSFLASVVP